MQTSLFEQENISLHNLLPKDGTVLYYGKIFSTKEADEYKNNLLHNIEWKNDEAVIFCKHITVKRKTAWYGDEKFLYRYSNIAREALPWTAELIKLKQAIEELTNETFNSCLLNLYHTGEEGVGWHSDGEPDLKKNGAIASVSFGAERKFVFKHKMTDEKVELKLEHGSLLIMKGTTQTHWLHRLPLMKAVHEARINLTFRTIVAS